MELTRHGVGPEKVVVEGGVGVDPLGWVQPEEFVDQVASERVLDVRTEALLHSERTNENLVLP